MNPESLIIVIAEKRAIGSFFPCLVLSYLRAVGVESKVQVTNKTIAEFFGVTPRYVTKAISELRRQGYLTEFEYNGRKRTISIAP